MPKRFECSRLAGDSLGWQTLANCIAFCLGVFLWLTAVDTPVSSFQLYFLISQDSSCTVRKLQTQDLLCYGIIYQSIETVRLYCLLQSKSYIFSAAPHQLKQDGARLKEATFAYLLSHRFDVNIFINSHDEQRNRLERVFGCREVTWVTKGQAE